MVIINSIVAVVLSVLATAKCTLTSTTGHCPGLYWTQHGKFITAVSSDVEGSYLSPASSAAACCSDCQNEPGCAYSQWDSAGCHIALAAGGTCSTSTVVGQFYTGTESSLGVLTLSNGPCGRLTYGGKKQTKRDKIFSLTSTKPTADVNTTCSTSISHVNGKAINLIEADVEGSVTTGAMTYSDCCAACYNQPGCAYFQFHKNSCSIALSGGACSSSTVVGKYYATCARGDALEIGNGPCGKLVYGGDQPPFAPLA